MGNSRFPTTHWSVVIQAGEEADEESSRALASLCEAYWYPVYARIRRVENDSEAARDLTQGFFYEVLEKRSVRVADPDRGRFRNYLTALHRHYLSHERRRNASQKRGGAVIKIALDFDSADIETRNPAGIVDLLRHATGVNVSQQGGRGGARRQGFRHAGFRAATVP